MEKTESSMALLRIDKDAVLPKSYLILVGKGAVIIY